MLHLDNRDLLEEYLKDTHLTIRWNLVSRNGLFTDRGYLHLDVYIDPMFMLENSTHTLPKLLSSIEEKLSALGTETKSSFLERKIRSSSLCREATVVSYILDVEDVSLFEERASFFIRRKFDSKFIELFENELYK